MTPVTALVRITNRYGMHARPAMAFAEIAMRYGATVRVRKGDQEVDGKSIMELMLLAATKDASIEIICEGDDADDCLDTLRALVERGFDEE